MPRPRSAALAGSGTLNAAIQTSFPFAPRLAESVAPIAYKVSLAPFKAMSLNTSVPVPPKVCVFPLVTKLPLGHALVPEALLRQRRNRSGVRSRSTPVKRSFKDTGVTKLELGHEGQNKPRRAVRSLAW